MTLLDLPHRCSFVETNSRNKRELNHATSLHLVPLLRVTVFERRSFAIRILVVYYHFAKITEKICNDKFAVLIVLAW